MRIGDFDTVSLKSTKLKRGLFRDKQNLQTQSDWYKVSNKNTLGTIYLP